MMFLILLYIMSNNTHTHDLYIEQNVYSKKLFAKIPLLLMLLCSIDASAVSVDECCRMARDNYPEVKRLQLIESTRNLTMHNIATQWLPQLSVSGQASWQNTSGDILEVFTPEGLVMLDNALRDVKPIKKWQYQAGVDVTQSVYDGGGIKLQRDIAAVDADIKQRDIDVQLYALDGRVEEVLVRGSN